MKHFAQIIVAAALTVFAAACTQETNTDIATAGFRKYSLSFAESTRTSLSGTGSTRQASWNAGDEILYYTAPYQSDAEIATVEKDGSSAHMVVPVSNATEFINAVYGAGELKSISSTGSYMYVTSPVTDSQNSTSFGQAHICAAFSADPEAKTLQFHNAAAILTFKGGESVYRVEFHGNGGEVITAGNDGALVISQDGDGIHVEPESVGGTTVSVQTGGSEDTFYVAILPVVFGNGIAVVSYDQNDKVLAQMQTSTELSAVSANGNARIISLGNAGNWKTNIGPEAVDLGLPSGILWASCNLGATSPEEYGDYFAWGETEPKEDYNWLNYKFRVSGDGWYDLTFYKYCTKEGADLEKNEHSYWESSEPRDNKFFLELEDDAASANLGGDWRIPTDAEWEELRTKCTWTWTTQDGVNGRLVTGPNGNSIFLPATGLRRDTDLKDAGLSGHYGSSLLFPMDSYDIQSFLFNSELLYLDVNDDRCYGLSVRPVLGKYVPVTAISIDQPNMELEVNNKMVLSATVAPENATSKFVYWTSSDSKIADVVYYDTYSMQVRGKSAGTVTLNAYASNGLSATCTLTVKNPEPEAVDLGLSVKWASWNVGANKPEEYGDYFAWGETAPKDDYSWDTYLWCDGGQSSINKYETVDWVNDNKTLLDLEDDAAHANWGGDWRMPTAAEWTELCNNCTLTETSDGCLVTGPNGNSIFLPDAGRIDGTGFSSLGGYYWSSSLWPPEDSFSNSASLFLFSSGSGNLTNKKRCLGLSVRPVLGKYVPVTDISIDQSDCEMVVGDVVGLTVTVNPSNPTDPTIRWFSTNPNVLTVDEYGNVTAIAPGGSGIMAYASNGLYAEWSTIVYNPAPQAVDLGLPSGIKWAGWNVGATSPEEYGDHFAWGEIRPKDSYSWNTYLWENSNGTLKRYNNNPDYGKVDDWDQLVSPDDAAYESYGGQWRTPTKADWEELRANCKWTWTNDYNSTGVKGYIVSGKKSGYTGKSIFLPAAGAWSYTTYSDEGSFGHYWSSSLYTDNPFQGWAESFYSSDVELSGAYRYLGYSVRAVNGEYNPK